MDELGYAKLRLRILYVKQRYEQHEWYEQLHEHERYEQLHEHDEQQHVW
jgi:hypothetical protein